MWPLAWPSVKEFEAAAWACSVLLASVLTASLPAELGAGETAPPASVAPPAALAAVSVAVAAVSLAASPPCRRWAAPAA
jgi:hypothetical protein